MPHVQLIYGNDGYEERVLMQSPSYPEFIERTSSPATPEQATNKLVKWFFSGRDAEDADCISFAYCPVDLSLKGGAGIGVYGVNGRHSYERASSYLHLYLSDLEDLRGKDFFSIFTTQFLTSKDIEGNAGSVEAAGAPALLELEPSDLDQSALGRQALKSVLLRLYRGEKAYILSDKPGCDSAYALRALASVYSFLPPEVRLAVGCMTYKPYELTQGTQVHINCNLFFMLNKEGNRSIENAIDMGGKTAADPAGSEQEAELARALDGWIALSFAQREMLAESCSEKLKRDGKSFSKLADYTEIFKLADKLHWWREDGRRYSLAQLREKFSQDPLLQGSDELRKEFADRMPRLLEGEDLDSRLLAHFREAQTEAELLRVDRDLLFFMDALDLPKWNEPAFIEHAFRIYSKANGYHEWQYKCSLFRSGSAAPVQNTQSLTAVKINRLYMEIDKRYDADWVASIPRYLYLRWNELVRSGDTGDLVEEIVRVYLQEKKSGDRIVQDWPEREKYVTDSTLNEYIRSLAKKLESNSAYEWAHTSVAWAQLMSVLEYASDFNQTIKEMNCLFDLIHQIVKILVSKGCIELLRGLFAEYEKRSEKYIDRAVKIGKVKLTIELFTVKNEEKNARASLLKAIKELNAENAELKKKTANSSSEAETRSVYRYTH